MRRVINNFQKAFNETKYWRQRYYLQNHQNKRSLRLFFAVLYCRRIESKRISQSGIGIDGLCCRFGKNIHLWHGWAGIIIARNVVIGDEVSIYQHVTIAEEDKTKTTRIGSHVVLGAGAVILNNVSIGDYAQIGANAVVTHDVPSYSIVCGVPAKIIGKSLEKK